MRRLRDSDHLWLARYEDGDYARQREDESSALYRIGVRLFWLAFVLIVPAVVASERGWLS